MILFSISFQYQGNEYKAEVTEAISLKEGYYLVELTDQALIAKFGNHHYFYNNEHGELAYVLFVSDEELMESIKLGLSRHLLNRKKGVDDGPAKT